MWIVSAIIAGLIVGALAKLIMPGRDPGGIVVTIVLGIAGSLLVAMTPRASWRRRHCCWAGRW